MTPKLLPLPTHEHGYVIASVVVLMIEHHIACAIVKDSTGIVEMPAGPPQRQVMLGMFVPDGSGAIYKYFTPTEEIDAKFSDYLVSTMIETYNANNYSRQ